jgi:hypothetical protein
VFVIRSKQAVTVACRRPIEDDLVCGIIRLRQTKYTIKLFRRRQIVFRPGRVHLAHSHVTASPRPGQGTLTAAIAWNTTRCQGVTDLVQSSVARRPEGEAGDSEAYDLLLTNLLFGLYFRFGTTSL